MNMEINTGDTVYWMDIYGQVQHGTVCLVYESGRVKVIGDIFDMKSPLSRICCNTKNVETKLEPSKCWPTKEACVEGELKRSRKRIDAFKTQMADGAGLMSFICEHDLFRQQSARDYKYHTIDTDALAAAKERAMELFGVAV